MTEAATQDEMRWVQIDAWHLIDTTEIRTEGLPQVTTRCGITQDWNQTFLDRLPGGDEKACENCLVLLAGDVDEPAEPKKRGRPPKA